MTGREESLRTQTFRAIVSATIAGGQFWVALNQATGVVVGTACWFQPGTDFLAE